MDGLFHPSDDAISPSLATMVTLCGIVFRSGFLWPKHNYPFEVPKHAISRIVSHSENIDQLQMSWNGRSKPRKFARQVGSQRLSSMRECRRILAAKLI
jgi:hypothetical protein